MVQPTEIFVLPRGMKAKISLPDGYSSGCKQRALCLLKTPLIFCHISLDAQELFGRNYVLPELGALGTQGLAKPRDFKIPVACFDLDQSNWTSKCPACV